MEDGRSCSWLGAGSVKGEEHYEEDGVGRWSLSQAQSQQELECEVREEQAHALSWTSRYSCFAFPVDRMSLVLFGSLELWEQRFAVFE